MTDDLVWAYALLPRIPAILQELLDQLPDKWVDEPEHPGAWSARDALCHLADLERDAWLPRLRAILEAGSPAALDGVDRERFRAFYAGRPLEDVLADFQRRRKANLADLRGLALDAESLAAKGRHPELGEVSLAQLLNTWVAHDLTHLAQIVRTLAAPYRDAVGPWKPLLSVLRGAS